MKRALPVLFAILVAAYGVWRKDFDPLDAIALVLCAVTIAAWSRPNDEPRRLPVIVFWFLIAFSASGCEAPKVLELEARFRPLERVRESSLPGLPPQGVATLGVEVLTRDMGALLYAYPAGSVDFTALMHHEQVHAIHQLADPTLLVRYAADPTARWSEEKAGWGVELAYLKANGRTIDVEWIAEVLSGPAYMGMVSKDEARKWVTEQIR